MDVDKLHESARKASILLKAMSNEHRLMILCQLLPGEKSVGELERVIGLSQSALSQHLARLRRDNLVRTRRQAQTIFYSLYGREAGAVIDTLYRLYCAPQESCAAE
ncbi:ArsR/SmtB family transcription factor [Magnetospirillum fulvum]|jgi:DNA-binding transcriptional ArsR family regulator|uniref:Transcriptional regulator n=1 Tax=Magnetospirillum fulvum MGU-K5 TaxID=1316936 RepID=S9TGQ1_MAGFU|nr:metalloregulator ArsR/SmtB family transcription factor [Magnetospirillum fulvum]EPY01466.1 transcriptional regulator [Magnetospirillum fulvum MGU-K5]